MATHPRWDEWQLKRDWVKVLDVSLHAGHQQTPKRLHGIQDFLTSLISLHQRVSKKSAYFSCAWKHGYKNKNKGQRKRHQWQLERRQGFTVFSCTRKDGHTHIIGPRQHAKAAKGHHTRVLLTLRRADLAAYIRQHWGSASCCCIKLVAQVACTHTYLHARTHTHKHMHTRTNARTHGHTHTHTHAHTHTQTHTHAQTQTHTLPTEIS
jgi:hypothetical protein